MEAKREENERLRKKLDQLNDLLKSMIELSKTNMDLVDKLNEKKQEVRITKIFVEDKLIKSVQYNLSHTN